MLLRCLLILVFSLFKTFVFCQTVPLITLKIITTELPTTHLKDTLFIAGNFNNWNVHDVNTALLKKENNLYETTLTIPKNNMAECKITRGNWDKVEVDINGNDLPNHVLNISGPATQTINIEAWKDDFSPKQKQHTASPQVHFIDTAFNLKALGKARRIWIYLPKDYINSKKHYPVVYMHDGQNLFDTYTSSFGEWGLDEILDSIFDKTKKSVIVVGIDNSNERMQEYNPYPQNDSVKKEGKAYVKSLVENLKPFVDEHYRTLKDRKNTSIAGSSMGGIISMWAVMQYPQIFGSAGIFSPSFWIAPPFKNEVLAMMKNYNGKLFFYAGGSESKTMVNDMDTIIYAINTVSNVTIKRKVSPNGQHNETAWQKAFPEFIEMLIGEK